MGTDKKFKEGETYTYESGAGLYPVFLDSKGSRVYLEDDSKCSLVKKGNKHVSFPFTRGVLEPYRKQRLVCKHADETKVELEFDDSFWRVTDKNRFFGLYDVRTALLGLHSMNTDELSVAFVSKLCFPNGLNGDTNIEDIQKAILRKTNELLEGKFTTEMGTAFDQMDKRRIVEILFGINVADVVCSATKSQFVVCCPYRLMGISEFDCAGLPVDLVAKDGTNIAMFLQERGIWPMNDIPGPWQYEGSFADMEFATGKSEEENEMEL